MDSQRNIYIEFSRYLRITRSHATTISASLRSYSLHICQIFAAHTSTDFPHYPHKKKERRNMKRHSSLYYFLYCPAHPDARSGTANVTGDTLRYERNVPTRCNFHREPEPRRIQTPCGSRLLSRLRQARRQHSSRRCRPRRLLP